MAFGARAFGVVGAAVLGLGFGQVELTYSPAHLGAIGKELQALCSQVTDTDKAEEAALRKHASPALNFALKSEAAFWRFLTGESTPYLDRMKAAESGGPLVGGDQLPRLWKAVAEIQQTPDGVELSPCEYSFAANLSPRMWLERKNRPVKPLEKPQAITFLDHKVQLPAQTVDYPFTLDARKQAPWIWQMKRVLPVLARTVWAYYADPTRYPVLFTAAWKWQPSNWYEAQTRSISLDRGPRNALRIEALVRLALEESFPDAAGASASLNVWGADSYHLEELVHAAQIVILQKTKVVSVAELTAYWTARLAGDTYDYPGTQLKPMRSATATLELARWARDNRLELFRRYYSFFSGLCRMVDDPPFRPNPGIDPANPDVAQSMIAFELWFERAKDRLQRESAVEKAHLRALARELHYDIE